MSNTLAELDLSQLPQEEETLKLIEFVAKELDEMKAINSVFINVKDISSVCDVMVVCSGSSNTHVKAIAGNLIEQSKKSGIELLGSEGQDSSEWILIDMGDVLVHVMQEQTREFYELEKLWTHHEENEDA
jgi:ribosome-associated protein